MMTAWMSMVSAFTVAAKLGESFETLACAATVKAETMDSHAVIIATLSTTNDELVATNARLVAQLSTALGKQKIPPPPGYPPSNQAPPPDTGHAMTTSGITAPNTYNNETKKNYFVTKYPCSHCKREGVTHVSVNCLYNPVNKDKLDAKNALQTARRAAAGGK